MGHVYRREGSKSYYLAYYNENGQLVRRSAGTTKQQIAEEMLIKIEAEILAKAVAGLTGSDGAPGGSAKLPSVAELHQRVMNLETAFRRFALWQAFQAQMFQFWGRSADNLMPAGWRSKEATFFKEQPEEGENDE